MDTQSTDKAQQQQETSRILARVQEVVPPILARYPVAAAYAFGSVARGTMTPFSDVNIAVLLATPLAPYERLETELAIQGDIEAASGFSPVDVRAIDQAPLLVQGRILQKGILLYEGDRARHIAFEVATRRRYFDFAPVARRLRDAFLDYVHRRGLLHG